VYSRKVRGKIENYVKMGFHFGVGAGRSYGMSFNTLLFFLVLTLLL
jgi:hypothetical protein